MLLWWSIALCAIFLIGVTKSGFGSGVGLMIVPMMAIAATNIRTLGAAAALGLLLPLLIAGDILAAYQYRNLFSFDIVRKLLPGTAVGLVIGGLLLWWFHNHSADVTVLLIRLEIGLESVALVALHWWRTARGTADVAYAPRAWHDHTVGGFSAVSSTLAHAAGPIITLYLLPQKLGRDRYVGTSAVYFFILNAAKLPVYWVGGQFRYASPLFALRFLPVVVAGALFGWWIKSRINDRLFSGIVYAVTFALGWYLLADAAVKLVRRA